MIIEGVFLCREEEWGGVFFCVLVWDVFVCVWAYVGEVRVCDGGKLQKKN